jgi:hypothetical protein
MPEAGIDEATLRQACEALAGYQNERALDDKMLTTPLDYMDWDVGPYEEWLVFSSPGGYTNQLFLVAGDTVYPFSLTTEGWEQALENARARKTAEAEAEANAPSEDEDELND